MSGAGIRRAKVLPAVAVLLGVAAISAALAADYLGAGQASGFGSKQILLATGGALAVILGISLLTSRGQAFLVEPREPDPLAPLGYGAVLVLGLWFGLATGLPEALLVPAQRLSGHRAIVLADYASWMPPLAYVVLFCIVGSLLALLSRAGWQSALRFKTVILGFCFLSALCLLFMFEAELHIAAIGILTIGLAVQGARILRWRPSAFLRLTRRTVVPLAILFTAVGASLRASQSIGERRELTALPAARQGAPNVLLIILDTVRSTSLSLYGHDRPTSPGLSRLAMESVVFDRAFSTASWTLPSHGSLFTGYYAHDLSADWGTPLDDAHATLAEFLRDRGYLTAGFVANRLYADRGSGLDRGFTHYDAELVSLSEIVRSTSIGRYVAELRWFQDHVYPDDLGRKRAETVTQEFLDWLVRSNDLPFFVFLNYFDAHDPYLPRQPYRQTFRTTKQKCTKTMYSPRRKVSEQDLRPCVDAYDGSIAELDHYLSLLFEELERRGVLGNTLVIVTSDHGEQFGDHGLVGHGVSLYLQSLSVPLLVSFPGKIPRGIRVGEAVTLRDVPATILDLLDIEPGHPFPGQTLARHWDGHASEEPAIGISMRNAIFAETNGRPWLRPHNPVSRGDMRSIIALGMHYILNGDGEEELYDIEADPWEVKDLVKLPSSRKILEQFRSLMATDDHKYAAPQTP